MRVVSRPEGVFKGRFSPRQPMRDPLAGMPHNRLPKAVFLLCNRFSETFKTRAISHGL